MTVIHVSGQDVVLEITDQCITGCVEDYCYKKGIVSPQGKHVPLLVIRERLEWIRRFTDVKRISLAGGEPWRHPQYIQICEVILGMGFGLDVITSCVIGPREKQNLEYSMQLFEAGLLDISLSYHGKRNHKQFVNVVNILKKLSGKRHQNLQSLGRDPMPEVDLYCMWIVGRDTNYDKETFLKRCNDCFKLVDLPELGYDNEVVLRAFGGYQSQFSDGKGQLNFGYRHESDAEGLRVLFTIRGQQEIYYTNEGPVISNGESGVCGAIRSKVNDLFVELPSIIIRTDRGVSFAEAHCVDMTHPLIFVGQNQTREEVYEAISGSLKQIQSHVFLYNRAKAKDNCDENGAEKECTACPFSRMCTPCWQTKRPWEK